MRSKSIGLFFCFMLQVALVPFCAASPQAVVSEFHQVLLSVMKDAESLQVRGRYEVLGAPVEKAFNLPFMMRVACGSSFKKASAGEQQRLVDAFTRMSVSTYAARFNDYSGERFRTVGERDGPREIRLVDTQIESPDRDPVALTYVTKQFDEEWKIVDVLFDGGISEMGLRVAQYRSILRNEGPAALADALDEKADAYLGIE